MQAASASLSKLTLFVAEDIGPWSHFARQRASRPFLAPRSGKAPDLSLAEWAEALTFWYPKTPWASMPTSIRSLRSLKPSTLAGKAS